ncbi:MAG: hypothetical protein JXN62_09055 [Bacteroidales bacterium]|nr:hypothetical protein [Bacteroidales bacterium]
MKKGILLSAIVFLLSLGISAQVADQTQAKTKKQLRIEAREQAKVQKQVQAMEQSGDPIMSQTQTRTQNHGAMVSETATQTQSGSGKGEMVREQAKLKGEAQKARVKTNNTAKTKNAGMSRPAITPGKGVGRK